jgi:hypothetical protein
MRLSEEIWCVLSRDGVIKKREIIGLFKDNSNQRVIEELSDLFGKIFESGILADDQLVKVLYMKENRIKEIKTPEKKTKSKYTEKQLELDNEMWSALRHRRVLKKEEHIELFNINSTKNVIEELVDLFGNISSSDIVSFEQLGKILEMIENRIIELNKPKSTSPEKKKIPKFTEQQLENEIIRLNPRVILIDSLNFNFDARAKYERQRKKAYQRLFANSYSNVKSKKQKIYVSGKISGIESIAPILFKSAENRLIEDGYEVVNPTTINHLDLL